MLPLLWMIRCPRRFPNGCHGTEGSTELGALWILTENLRLLESQNVVQMRFLYSIPEKVKTGSQYDCYFFNENIVATNGFEKNGGPLNPLGDHHFPYQMAMLWIYDIFKQTQNNTGSKFTLCTMTAHAQELSEGNELCKCHFFQRNLVPEGKITEIPTKTVT